MQPNEFPDQRCCDWNVCLKGKTGERELKKCGVDFKSFFVSVVFPSVINLLSVVSTFAFRWRVMNNREQNAFVCLRFILFIHEILPNGYCR